MSSSLVGWFGPGLVPTWPCNCKHTTLTHIENKHSPHPHYQLHYGNNSNRKWGAAPRGGRRLLGLRLHCLLCSFFLVTAAAASSQHHIGRCANAARASSSPISYTTSTSTLGVPVTQGCGGCASRPLGPSHDANVKPQAVSQPLQEPCAPAWDTCPTRGR